MSKKMEWIQAASLIAGSTIAIIKTVIQYNEFKREQGTLEYTRELQRRAWDKVISGELAEAKVGEMTIRGIREPSAPDPTEPSANKENNAAPLPSNPKSEPVAAAASNTPGRGT